jgi:thiol-disulfide isomerase/thioredoxin
MNMRITISIFFLIGSSSNGIAQAVLSGTVTNFPPQSIIEVLAPQSEFNEEYATFGQAVLDHRGSFKLAIPIETSIRAELMIGDEMTFIYLMPSDSLHLTVDYSQFDESIQYTGRGAANNNLLKQRLLHAEQFEEANAEPSEEAEYLSYQDAKEKWMLDFLHSYDTTGVHNTLFEDLIHDAKYSTYYKKLLYLHSYNPETNTLERTEVSSSYLDFLKALPLNDSSASANSNYQNAIASYFDYLIVAEIPYDTTLDPVKASDLWQAEFYNRQRSALQGEIRDYRLKAYLQQYLPYLMRDKELADSLVQDFMSICTNDGLRNEMSRIYENQLQLIAGQDAPEFELNDVTGRKVTLAFFHGKLVFIDFWASWCAPCIAGLPKTKALQEKFKQNDDVVFLYVNMGEPEATWKSAINKFEIAEVNVRATPDQERELQASYGFNGIPHYVLIDKDGKFISSKITSLENAELEILQRIGK